jgi:hypothetical protein
MRYGEYVFAKALAIFIDTIAANSYRFACRFRLQRKLKAARSKTGQSLYPSFKDQWKSS